MDLRFPPLSGERRALLSCLLRPETLPRLPACPPDDFAWRILSALHPRIGTATALRQSWLRCAPRLHTARGLVRSLLARDIPVMLFKGTALPLGLGCDPATRPVGDVDVLVRPTHFEEAIRVTREQGWQVMPSIRPHPGGPHASSLVGPGRTLVDLHWSPLWDGRDTREADALWNRSLAVDWMGARVHIPSREDQLVHTLVHGFLTRDPHLSLIDALRLWRAGIDQERYFLISRAHDGWAAIRAAQLYLESEFGPLLTPAWRTRFQREVPPALDALYYRSRLARWGALAVFLDGFRQLRRHGLAALGGLVHYAFLRLTNALDP